MTKEEIYKVVVDVVTGVTQPREDWMKSRDEESVMTRGLVINALFKMGFSRSQIGEMTGLKRSAIIAHVNKWDERTRCSRLLVAWEMMIRRRLGAIDFWQD